MSDMTALDVLVKAREQISSPECWGKGDYVTDGGRLCAAGALNWAATGLPTRGTFASCVAAAVVAKTVGRSHSIIPWNDAPDTTHADVLAAFDRAIEAERKRVGS